MLTMLLPLTVLCAYFKKKWHVSSMWIMLTTPIIMLYMYSPLMTPSFSLIYLQYDTMTTPLILLTTWTSALMIYSSLKSIQKKKKKKEKILTILILTTTLILAFSSFNMWMFYLMFELSVIPTAYLILTWGYQPERIMSTYYLMFYTVTASLPLLVAMIFISWAKHPNLLTAPPSLWFYSTLMWAPTSCNIKVVEVLWVCMLMAFLVKIPMYAVHMWLPKAHVEAPVAGSMILAGVLLKLGGYGMARIHLMFPNWAGSLNKLFATWSMWGALIASLICIAQTDIKSLIAYSSVSHMALLIASLSSMCHMSLSGAMIIMIGHGLISPAMFAMANMIYETSSTRSIFLSKGLINTVPVMSMMMFVLCASNMAAPPSINLLAEISLMMSIMVKWIPMITLIGSLLFMAAVYSLILFSSTQHGKCSYSLNFSSHLSMNNMNLLMMLLIPSIMCTMSPEFMMTTT